ncbi:prolyl oligopeptidase family serine peptidase [Stieleria sp. TO1_6]|uniref:carboxylesterase family protein n=1 Tax=Stieleria tagensis TaxID=2956795 RepID=UPI00209B5EB7|nr:prolyl oligopeptidase family serine peptidase [Stieleria tagensis]MCO8121143.1 prolyl oligopeptidase family serine peptidase [Stieleria tagensis]
MLRCCWIFLRLAFVVAAVAAAADSAPPQTLQRSPDQTRPGLNYWISVPDVDQAESEQRPALLLFLHGGGEGGGTADLVKKHGPPRLIDQGKRFPCLVISPQNPSKSQHWDDQQLIELVDHVCAKFNVDPTRVYLTGMSRGCYGGWRLLVQHPNRFAAFVGVCGGGLAPYVKRVADVPIRLYHGDQDRSIPLEESQRMCAAHRAAGGDCQLTIYPGVGHDAWEQAYADDQMYQWLFAQRRR